MQVTASPYFLKLQPYDYGPFPMMTNVETWISDEKDNSFNRYSMCAGL
jgi:hypothetical protein